MTPLYSKRVLCFPLPNNSDKQNQYIFHLLLTALQSTVRQLPFLAGSIVPFSKEQPWLRDIRPHGAAYLEVQDLSHEISFLDLRNSQFSPSLLDTKQLCPFPDPVYSRDDPIDVCRLRANFVDGGLLLVVSIIHTVCDGHGITDVLEIFAEKLREAQTNKNPNHPKANKDAQEPPYSLDRTSLLSGLGLPGVIENHPAWTASPLNFNPGPVTMAPSCSIFHISSDSLRALKQAASTLLPSSSASAVADVLHLPPDQQIPSSDQATSISTHDAIAALIWRTIMFARYRAGVLSSQAITSFSQAVDCRTRLGLPDPYFGNAIYGIKTSLALPRLAPAIERFDRPQIPGLQAAARAIRTEVVSATGDKFQDLLAFVERTQAEVHTRPSVLDELSTGSIMLVSYFGLEMYGMNFGAALGGKIEAFRLPSQGLVPGIPVVLPRLPDGSCEVVINERDDVTKFLADDELFRRFTSTQC